MNTLHHIRSDVLKVTQAEMAAIAGTSQATVSRWENGTLHPDREHMVRIRNAAKARGLAWDDELFFTSPPRPAPAEVRP